MKKEAEKVFHGITYIDDDLLEEFKDSRVDEILSGKRKEQGKSLKYIGKRFGIMLSAASLLAFIIILCLNTHEAKMANEEKGEQVQKGDYINSEMQIGGKAEKKQLVLNEQVIVEQGINDVQFKKLDTAIKESADYGKILEAIETWLESEKEGFVVIDVEGLSISKFNLPTVNINDASVSNIAYEFLFSDKKPVGYVMFFMVKDELEYSISLNTEETYGYYFDFLEKNKEGSFVILTDGKVSYFLSEDNILYNASTGREVKGIVVEGEYYQALGRYDIAVSYEKVMSEIELLGNE